MITNNLFYADTTTADYHSAVTTTATDGVFYTSNGFFSFAGTALTVNSENSILANNFIFKSGKTGLIFNATDGVASYNYIFDANQDGGTSNLHNSGIAFNNHDRVYGVGNIMHSYSEPSQYRALYSGGYTDASDSSVQRDNHFHRWAAADPFFYSGSYIDPWDRVVTLSAGTTTDVDMDITFGASFQVHITLIDSAAHALDPYVAQWRTNGFRITHGTAAGTEQVMYSIRPAQMLER